MPYTTQNGALGPRDRQELVDAIGRGRVYRNAAGRIFRRTGGGIVAGGNPNGRVPVARRHIDALVAEGAAYLDEATGTYRLPPPAPEVVTELLLDPVAVCGYCLEDKGWCVRAGGVHPCEGDLDAAQDIVSMVAAPEVWPPLRGGPPSRKD